MLRHNNYKYPFEVKLKINKDLKISELKRIKFNMFKYKLQIENTYKNKLLDDDDYKYLIDKYNKINNNIDSIILKQNQETEIILKNTETYIIKRDYINFKKICDHFIPNNETNEVYCCTIQ
jgi:hypothetical protein